MTRPHHRLELGLKVTDEGEVLLTSPDVGGFTGALQRGATLAPGMVAGSLHFLGRAFDLIVPAGAGGMVLHAPRTAVVAPTSFGDVLYTLDPTGTSSIELVSPAASLGLEGNEAPVMANQPGRVWHSPSPDADPFCVPGDVLTDGTALCLIEVMKTFSTVPYRATDGLPPRAKLVRWLVENGGDVEPGTPMLTVEPA